MKLSSLQDTKTATIIRIALRAEYVQRLFFLGIYPGASITRIMAAPMHDPVLYMVQGCQIVLRKQESDRIDVAVWQ